MMTNDEKLALLDFEEELAWNKLGDDTLQALEIIERCQRIREFIESDV